MLIESRSDLFDSYLGANDAWDIMKVNEKGHGAHTPISRLIYKTRLVWVILFALGIVAWMKWSEVTFLLTFVPGSVGCFWNFATWCRGANEEDEAHKKVLEYNRLLKRLGDYLEADKEVIEALTIEDLQELAVKKLREFSADVVRVQSHGSSGTDQKLVFRKAHACMLKLGLVEPKWDRYFVN